MSKRCEHQLMNRANRICEAKARFLATLQDGSTMLVCGRHGNSLAVASGSGRPVSFSDLTDEGSAS